MLSNFKEKRRKAKQERDERLLAEFLEVRNLTGLASDDRVLADMIRDGQEAITDHPLRGSESETAHAQLLVTIIEQNWLIIKLLNGIDKKLGK